MTIGVDVGDDSGTVACGIRGGHAYTLVSGFTMTDQNGTEINLLIVRDPWGTTDYNGEWNANDTRWNDQLIKQVPLGIDPRKELLTGMFFVGQKDLVKCF